MDKVFTYDDRQSLYWHYEEKRTVEDWYDWDNLKDVIALEYPELITTVDRLKSDNRILELIINDIHKSMG